MKLIVIICTLFSIVAAQEALPLWFYKTPNGALVVTTSDNITKRGRALALLREANRLLALERETIAVRGEVGFATGTGSGQKDRFMVDFNFTEKINSAYLQESGLRLLDYVRIKGNVQIALFGNDDTEFSTSREARPEPTWVGSPQSSTDAAIGFGKGDVRAYSGYLTAFKHALFNLTMAEKTRTFTALEKRANSGAKKSLSKLNVNFGEAEFSGLQVFRRWLAPDGTWYVELRKVNQ